MVRYAEIDEFHTPTPPTTPHGAGGCGSGDLSIEIHTPHPHPHTAGLNEYDYETLDDETAARIVRAVIERGWR